MKCGRCGCTDERACVLEDGDGGEMPCSWVLPGVCSGCATVEDYEIAADQAEAEPAAPLLYDAYGGVLVR
jgi:hypothetical protein